MKKPQVTTYWLGPPSQYHPSRKDLEGLPRGDAGGREIGLPEELTPQMLYDQTMPELQAVHKEAQKRFTLGAGNGKLHPFGVLAQGIYVTWIFASMQMTKLYEMLVLGRQEAAKSESRINALEKRIQELEDKLGALSPDA